MCSEQAVGQEGARVAAAADRAEVALGELARVAEGCGVDLSRVPNVGQHLWTLMESIEAARALVAVRYFDEWPETSSLYVSALDWAASSFRLAGSALAPGEPLKGVEA